MAWVWHCCWSECEPDAGAPHSVTRIRVGRYVSQPRVCAEPKGGHGNERQHDLLNSTVRNSRARTLSRHAHDHDGDVDLTDFAVSYAHRVRTDHALFVEAFREGRIGGVTATA